MSRSLFAGIQVREFAPTHQWYVQLLGSEPSFFAHETEAVWEIGPDGWVYVVENPEHAGHAVLMIMVDDLDAVVAEISARGIEPARLEDYGGARKAVYQDPDGNELSFGGAPV